jgi:hypothetical protein
MDYATACHEASLEQGITPIVSALSDLGIKAEIAQTGGFTMCAYIELTSSRYIYANTYGSSVYSDDDYLCDIKQYDERQSADQIAKDVHNYINN